jgi:catechol 2,3-dioxygenase-like lactoylglutathione lyase family enzyme
MFSHIVLGSRDLLRSAAFYDAVLKELGMLREGDGTIGDGPGLLWRFPGQRWPQFCVQPPFNGLPPTGGNGVQISFAAASHAAVDAAWRTAVAQGGADEGAPGLRERYASDYYGAYCRDPDGNKLCFVHAGSRPAQP